MSDNQASTTAMATTKSSTTTSATPTTQTQAAAVSVGQPAVAPADARQVGVPVNGGVGQAGAPPGQLGVQQPAVPVVPRSKPLGSSKPPKFNDTFEVYQMGLKPYLEQRDSWGVVTGDETRHAFDPVLQRQFDDRNRLAMETITA
jgi:hypothetical protein